MMTAQFNGVEYINGALVKMKAGEETFKSTIAIWTRDTRRDQPIKEALWGDFVEKIRYISQQKKRKNCLKYK
jgi:hypothetical protein